MKYIVPTSILLLLLVGCTPTEKPAEIQPVQEEVSLVEFQAYLEESNADYSDRYSHSDSVYYKSHYTADACIFPPYSPAICTPDSIGLFYYHDGLNKDFDVQIKTTNVYAAGEIMVEEGQYEFLAPDAQTLDAGKFIALWKRELGIWKLYREIWNSDKKE